jgi:hypothetical protein
MSKTRELTRLATIHNDSALSNRNLIIDGAIAESKAITAVDGFAYDTRNDSDGGAWIYGAKARASSWYNETLNTATRGATRAFPAVAVIIAEANKVTIYDGDDPDLPMWMVFNSSGLIKTGTASAITALNGVISRGDSASLIRIDLLSDMALRYRASGASAGSFGKASVALLNRNATTDYDNSTPSLVNSTVNGVAMTVLPNAPIDPATGIQVPTIAVATDAGVSVITDGGDVFDSDYTGVIGDVAFDEEFSLFHMRGVSTYSLRMATLLDYTSGDGFGDFIASANVGQGDFDMLGTRQQSTTVFGKGVVVSGGYGAGELVLGLHQINKSNLSNGMSAGITSTYNTGWMPGDIKGAWLSSVDDTDLVGAELVTNGDFATDTDWTKGTGWTIGSGVASADASAVSSTELLQTITTVAGEQYVIVWELVSRSAGSVRARAAGIANSGTETAAGVYSFYFTANSTTTSLGVQDTDGSFVGSVDNISVRLADADRSVNDNGLAVYGTVTKTAVATGAELMAYSGFSASNYLEQPYNADLDAITNTMHILFWANGFVAGDTVVHRGHRDTDSSFGLYIDGGNGVRFYGSSDGTTDQNSEFQLGTIPSGWNLYCVGIDTGSYFGYLNGVPQSMSSPTFTSNIFSQSSAQNPLTIALGGFSSQILSGSISLLRISATAPSAAQVAKIYNDEKHLFADNALAVLSADDVTALSHDPVTDLLYVGGASGMATVSGITPVSRDATAVSTFISVVDGMEIKQ